MESRLPRFKRAPIVASMQLMKRDHGIIRLIHRHRFLRSNQIIALLGGSPPQGSRRLKLLYYHGYLERPRAQLQYYDRGGSRNIAYGLGNKGGALLRLEHGFAVHSDSWSEKNHVIGRVYLEHALLVSDVMVAIELACRKRGDIHLLHDDQLTLHTDRQPLRWRVTIQNGWKLGVIPDRVFALEYTDQNCQTQRVHFSLKPTGEPCRSRAGLFPKLPSTANSSPTKQHGRRTSIAPVLVSIVSASLRSLPVPRG